MKELVEREFALRLALPSGQNLLGNKIYNKCLCKVTFSTRHSSKKSFFPEDVGVATSLQNYARGLSGNFFCNFLFSGGRMNPTGRRINPSDLKEFSGEFRAAIVLQEGGSVATV